MSLGIYMSITRDTDLMPAVLERIYDLVDEIVVVDGPYRWVEEAYAGLGIDWSPREILFRGKPLAEHTKVRYFWESWADQPAKRKFGYEQCGSEIVMPLDADELLTLDMESVERFASSDYSVGRLEIVNLVRSYARLGRRAGEPPAEHAAETIPLSRLFKRERVSGVEHLDHLWLYSSGPKPKLRMDVVQCGVICGRITHLTQMRDREGHLFKYLYYRARYNRGKEASDPILRCGGWSSYQEMLRAISLEDYEELFLRMGQESMRCPLSFTVLPYEESDPGVRSIVAPLDDVTKDFGTSLRRELPLLPELPIYSYLRAPGAGAKLSIVAPGAGAILVTDHPVRFDADNRGGAKKVATRRTGEGTFECRLEPYGGEDLFARLIAVQLPKGAEPARLVSIEEMPAD